MTAAQIADIARLLADRSRAAICLALIDGRAWTVGELARHAEIGPSTASEHVARLADGGLVGCARQGRNRYVRLAGPAVAQLIEEFAAYAAPDPGQERVRSLRAVRASEALSRARTCYDHLAGRLGVAMADNLTGAGLLDQEAGFAFTNAGVAWLKTAMDIDVATLPTSRRPLVRPCIDWTERRPHVGGTIGAAICAKFFADGWVSRIGTGRAVRLTPDGTMALTQIGGIKLPDVA